MPNHCPGSNLETMPNINHFVCAQRHASGEKQRLCSKVRKIKVVGLHDEEGKARDRDERRDADHPYYAAVAIFIEGKEII